MKTVIAIEDGQITSDSTSSARLISFKKGDEIQLNDMQADFLVECGKAEHVVYVKKAADPEKTDEEKAAEAEEKAKSKEFRAGLKKKAAELGLEFAKNVSNEQLEQLIEAKENELKA